MPRKKITLHGSIYNLLIIGCNISSKMLTYQGKVEGCIFINCKISFVPRGFSDSYYFRRNTFINCHILCLKKIGVRSLVEAFEDRYNSIIDTEFKQMGKDGSTLFIKSGEEKSWYANTYPVKEEEQK